MIMEFFTDHNGELLYCTKEAEAKHTIGHVVNTGGKVFTEYTDIGRVIYYEEGWKNNQPYIKEVKFEELPKLLRMRILTCSLPPCTNPVLYT